MSERQKPSASNQQPPPQQQQQQQGGDAAAGDSCSDEPANQQLPDCQQTPAPTPTSPSPSPSPAASGAPCVARVASDASARSEPANQQVLPENLESDRPSRPARVTKREGSVVSDHCGSIVIPVGQSTSSSSTIVSSATSVRRHTGSSDSDVKATVRERNAAMLFNDCMADVHFLVGAPGANSVSIFFKRLTRVHIFNIHAKLCTHADGTD
uniref:Uncharacterized protein n=1 Tax=Plectus sambesii TaxID=2011161 RepID=A0A914UXC6_9BILA